MYLPFVEMYKSHYVHVVQVVYLCVYMWKYIACKIKLIMVTCFLFPYVYVIEICTLCGSICMIVLFIYR